MPIPDSAELLTVLPLDWTVERAELQVRLTQAFEGSPLSSPSRRWRNTDDSFRRPIMEGETATGTDLCYAPVQTGVVFFLLAENGGEVPDRLASLLRDALDKTITSMGQPPLKIQWWAVIANRNFP